MRSASSLTRSIAEWRTSNGGRDPHRTRGGGPAQGRREPNRRTHGVMLTPYPGTVDFEAWEKRLGRDAARVGGVPITRHWLIPQDQRPTVYAPHPVMSAEQIREDSGRVG
jgi:hypothetical protein